MPPTQHRRAPTSARCTRATRSSSPTRGTPARRRSWRALGFKALASTSSGFAFTLGRLDGAATLDEVVEHAGALDRATSLPVSVDLENGYGPGPQDVARAIARVAEAGAVGASIEDYDADDGIYAARARGGARGGGRRGRPRASTSRSRSPRAPRTTSAATPTSRTPSPACRPTRRAGADVLYAPGLRSAEEIRAVCDAVSKPVNVLAHRGLSMSEIVEAGGRRISVGGALTWVAVGALVAAAEQIRDHGDFSALVAPAAAGRVARGRRLIGRQAVTHERLVDQRAHPDPGVVGAEEHLGEEEHGHVGGRVDPERGPGGALPAVLAGHRERLGRDRVDERARARARSRSPR